MTWLLPILGLFVMGLICLDCIDTSTPTDNTDFADQVRDARTTIAADPLAADRVRAQAWEARR